MLVDFYQAQRRFIHAQRQSSEKADAVWIGPHLGPGRDNYNPEELAMLTTCDFTELHGESGEEYAFKWYELFSQSWAADALSETLIETDVDIEFDAIGYSEYVFYTFEGARVMLSWLGRHQINAFNCRPEQLEIYLLGVYPTMLTFDPNELSLDLLEFRAVFDFFRDLGSATGQSCADLLDQKMQDRVLGAANTHDQKVNRGLRPKYPWIRGYMNMGSNPMYGHGR
jgi:hypothetical protein